MARLPKLITKKIKLASFGQTYRDDPFMKAMIQRRIDRTQEAFGYLVEKCKCKKCFAQNILIFNLTMFATSMQLDGLEYTIVRKHPTKKH